MSTPLVASSRFTIAYAITGATHKIRLYCRNAQLQGTDYYINSRTLDENDLLAESCAQRAVKAIAYMCASTTTFSDVLLEKFTGSQWVPVATYAPGTYTVAGFGNPASQITVTFRDKYFNHVKLVIMEGNQGANQHFSSLTGGDTYFDSMIPEFTSAVEATSSPYVWMVGRSNQFLATNPFIMATTTNNRKLRRMRGFV